MAVARYLVPIVKRNNGWEPKYLDALSAKLQEHVPGQYRLCGVIAKRDADVAGDRAYRNGHYIVVVKTTVAAIDALDAIMPSDVVKLDKAGVKAELEARGITIPQSATVKDIQIKVLNWLGIDERPGGFADFPEMN